jgi:A/G-specific adenine glycosylase
MFMEKFPDVNTLANASLGDVLRIWSGLGYNRRAKHLHAAAKIITREYEGKFPHDFLELQKLPGIGRSTAAAVMAFAWNESYPMIDTNVRRILVRCFYKDYFPTDSELFEFAQKMIPPGRGRAWNYAMLDIGATACTARRHAATCPLIDLHGEVDDFVYKKPQTKFKGSKRSYRGKLLKTLAVTARMSRVEAEALFDGTPHDGAAVIDELVREGLLREVKKHIMLPA